MSRSTWTTCFTTFKAAVRLVAVLAITAAPAAAQPKLEVLGGASLDLGTIYRGVLAERKVALRNAGNGTLIIEKVEASCGCTGTVVSNDHIAPDSSGSLLITFNSKNFSGKVHKTVTVTSNDPGSPQTLIEFSGTVVDEVALSPQQLWFQDAVIGKTSEILLTITNGGAQPLRLSGARTDLEGFSLTLPPAPLEPGKSATLNARFTPSKAQQLLVSGVFVKTSSLHQPEVYIPIYGNVKASKGK